MYSSLEYCFQGSILQLHTYGSWQSLYSNMSRMNSSKLESCTAFVHYHSGSAVCMSPKRKSFGRMVLHLTVIVKMLGYITPVKCLIPLCMLIIFDICSGKAWHICHLYLQGPIDSGYAKTGALMAYAVPVCVSIPFLFLLYGIAKQTKLIVEKIYSRKMYTALYTIFTIGSCR